VQVAIILVVIGLLQLYIAFNLTVIKWLLIWSAISFMIVGMGYVWFGPGVLGKRSDGKMDKWRVFALLPFFLLIWAKWWIRKLLAKEECWNRIIPDLYLGRRASANELPDDIKMIVDLTAEFSTPIYIESIVEYLCCPTLDNSAMELRHLQELVNVIVACRGGVYVHCALGHGRSATVVGAVLLAKGVAGDAEEAVALMREARPKVRLNKHQRRLLDKFSEQIEVH
jgi:protein-tyrosine phosphatase